MDPDISLQVLRQWSVRYVAMDDDEEINERDAVEDMLAFIAVFDGLDQWLSRQGYLPAAWKSKHTETA